MAASGDGMEAAGGDEKKEVVVLVVIVVVAALAVVSLIVAFSYYCYIRSKVSKRSKQNIDRSVESRNGGEKLQVVTEKGLQVFNFKQLLAATGGFGKVNVVGHGGFGCVYKGVLTDGRKIAVKLMDRSGKQGEEEFEMEVELLSRLHSPYLLALLGYCTDNDHKLLVYEYMPNGGLQEHLYPESAQAFANVYFWKEITWYCDVSSMQSLFLFVFPLLIDLAFFFDGKENEEFMIIETKGYRSGKFVEFKMWLDRYTGAHGGVSKLDWETRMRIALDAARGLEYLHERVNPPVIHRDFKSSNILLDKNFHAKVSDFGLAKLGSEKAGGHVSTRVLGTQGYVAPEYALTGHLTTKSDVYSYGVVLLELLTGRVPVDMKRAPGEGVLVSWAHPPIIGFHFPDICQWPMMAQLPMVSFYNHWENEWPSRRFPLMVLAGYHSIAGCTLSIGGATFCYETGIVSGGWGCQYREKVLQIMDPALEGQYLMKEVIQVAAIAAMCVQAEADYRPLMADVVQSLVPLVKNQKPTSRVGSFSSFHATRSPTASECSK
ncbi:hypothetical protein ACLOJK_008773 [Asimina triloba]